MKHGKIYFKMNLLSAKPVYISETGFNNSKEVVIWKNLKNCLKASGQLPENDRLEINGTACVHRYYCITDYIFKSDERLDI